MKYYLMESTSRMQKIIGKFRYSLAEKNVESKVDSDQ